MIDGVKKFQRLLYYQQQYVRAEAWRWSGGGGRKEYHAGAEHSGMKRDHDTPNPIYSDGS